MLETYTRDANRYLLFFSPVGIGVLETWGFLVTFHGAWVRIGYSDGV